MAILQTTSTTTLVKLGSYPVLVGIISYFGLASEQLLILAGLLLLDTCTGILREFVVSPQTFSSRVGIIGVVSKFLVFSLPFIVATVIKGGGLENMQGILNITVSTLIVYEGWSILANIGQIRAKDKTLSQYDAISFLIKKIQNILKAVLSTVLQKDK